MYQRRKAWLWLLLRVPKSVRVAFGVPTPAQRLKVLFFGNAELGPIRCRDHASEKHGVVVCTKEVELVAVHNHELERVHLGDPRDIVCHLYLQGAGTPVIDDIESINNVPDYGVSYKV